MDNNNDIIHVFLPSRPALDETWKDQAACRGMDTNLFFPSRGDYRTLTHAQRVCSTCPVARQCADYALRLGEHFGVWGGTSERQRRGMRRELDGRPLPVIQHGTIRGYSQHRRFGSTPCDACRSAHAAYQREYKDRRKEAS